MRGLAAVRRKEPAMTAEISIVDDALIVDIRGADRLWALKSRLEIPLGHVAGAGPAETEARQWLHGARLGGTHVPGVLSAGRFYSHGTWVFWDVHHPPRRSASTFGTSTTANSWLRPTIPMTRSAGSGKR
jgi:hypothetical protein